VRIEVPTIYDGIWHIELLGLFVARSDDGTAARGWTLDFVDFRFRVRGSLVVEYDPCGAVGAASTLG
jgi:hypothetical protein